MELRLQELESIPQLEALGEGRLDIGFIRPPPVLPDGVATLVLLREPLWLALPQQHPLSAQTAIRVEELADEPFVTPDAEMSTGFYHHTLSLGRRAGFTPRLVHHGRDLVAVAALVALGIGVALVPDSLRESLRLPGLTYRPLAGEPLHAELAAAFRRNEAAPATRAFIRQLRRQARSAAG
ncbi:LysR family substrate-binding domain-containing protein [Roseomonas marmotae]|uniref:LysR family substrate-binding domain-containing protein n=1 Tax=Roseomonas marmotae TaxID=2768161 RepID=UPI0023519E6F|nr:LysR family substrate-binding domain-containing protein [Roseomonas marmotae]